MSSEKELILSTVSDADKAKVEFTYDQLGLVQTVLQLVGFIWNNETKRAAEQAISSRDEKSVYYKLLFEKYNVEEHFKQSDSHREFIRKAYMKLRKFVPNVTEEDIEIHDLSKYNFIQAIGYTAKWVHKVDCSSWEEALVDHYAKEPHHPQKFGEGRMLRKYLEESVVDMAACRWERQLKGDDNVTNYDLVDFNDQFLTRYHKDDFIDVKALIKEIKDSEEEQM